MVEDSGRKVAFRIDKVRYYFLYGGRRAFVTDPEIFSPITRGQNITPGHVRQNAFLSQSYEFI